MLDGVQGVNDNRALAKATILLASAALESNLMFFAKLAIRFNENNTEKLSKPQLDFLNGHKDSIDDSGQVVRRPLKQTFLERMRIIPKLLAKCLTREYELTERNSKLPDMLNRLIERRDAIMHPRWDNYIAQIGWWEAAEAIDAVELYLDSVRASIHPYLIGYTSMLYMMQGADDVDIGSRTVNGKEPDRRCSTMEETGIHEVILAEWFDAMFLANLAFSQESEKDSNGSMLTRAALVYLYGMLDAHLAVVSQWKMKETPSSFSETEVLFLNEAAAGIGHDGEVFVEDEQHSFKTRIKAIPGILARCVEKKEFKLDLGEKWGADLLSGNDMRAKVMHTGLGQKVPRVSKDELMMAAKAICKYFEKLNKALPVTFAYMPELITVSNKFLVR